MFWRLKFCKGKKENINPKFPKLLAFGLIDSFFSFSISPAVSPVVYFRDASSVLFFSFFSSLYLGIVIMCGLSYSFIWNNLMWAYFIGWCKPCVLHQFFIEFG
jgi:hypothetical protein